MTQCSVFTRSMAVVAAIVCMAWGTPVLDIPDSLNVTLFGYGSIECGQIVKGQYAHATYPQGELLHFWIQQSLMQIGLTATNPNGLKVALAGEGALYFPYSLPGDGAGFGYELLGPRSRWYIHQAEVSYSMGDAQAHMLRFAAGYFPFKYNPDARNFGDFLLRINSYPQYLPTHFDAAYTRLFGFRINSTLFNTLQQDVMLTSEVNLWPLKDFSLSYLASCSFMQVVDVGAGIMGHRMFSVNERLTTPPNASRSGSGDTFTFASTKAMFRLALDFKPLLPFSRIFGENDGRIYSEVCFNGLKNYVISDTNNPNYPGYNDLMKRMPTVFGINIPTFKILDLFSVEGEWWDNNFANSYWGVFPNGGGYDQNPNPWRYGKLGYRKQPYGGPWHWSVYLKKTFFNNVCIIAQAARDHTVLETTLTGTSNGDPEEAMDGRGNWAWMTKVAFFF